MIEGLIGPQQRKMMTIAERLNEAFGPSVTAEFRREYLYIEFRGKEIKLDHDFRLVGESCRPMTEA